jgi:predicted DNA-binding protein
MYRNKKLKKLNEVTLRFDDEYFDKVNALASHGERAPLLRKIIEDFIDEQELIGDQRRSNFSEVRH